jgi:hypothetical protein
MTHNIHFRLFMAQFSLEGKMFRTKFVQKIKPHIFSTINFSFENGTIFKVMWKNIVEPGRPQMTKWRMHIACWIRKDM